MITTSLEYKKQKDFQLQASVPDRELRHLHLQQLHEQDQPFTGTKHLPKEQCFTSCLLRQMISNFSKKELERLHLTRSQLGARGAQEPARRTSFRDRALCMSILQRETFYRFSLSTTSSLQRTLGIRLSEKQLQQNLSTGSSAASGQKSCPDKLSAAQLRTPQLQRKDLEQ